MKSLFRILSRFIYPPAKKQAQERYIALVRQSRNPFFYRDCGVADTLDGRFEIIVLHLFLNLREAGRDDEAARLLLEAFFADMDRSLRELGVGDMSVGKKVGKMAEATFGRLKAYEESAHDPALLKEKLLKNVYGGHAPAPEAVQQLADYMLTATLSPMAAAR